MKGELLMVRVAELSYDEDKTQGETGTLLGISRWKVGRLLTQARDLGIVRIDIVHPCARRLSVERSLVERFGLKDAVVVPAPNEPATVLDRVARAAADMLAALRPVPHTLAVSWGRTLTALADALPAGWARRVTVVQTNGGVSLNRRSGGTASVAVTIALRGAGHTVLLPSPAIL